MALLEGDILYERGHLGQICKAKFETIIVGFAETSRVLDDCLLSY